MKPEKAFIKLHQIIDDKKLREHLIPENFNYEELCLSYSSFFNNYGFKIPGIFSYAYEKYNGIKSDKYISTSFYYYYILPFLQNMNFSLAYVDKNFYDEYFKDINQPETILKKINGRFYRGGLVEYNPTNILINSQDFIIKPSIESGSGMNVKVVKGKISKKEIELLLKNYNGDFIVQKLIKQSKVLSLLNPTSVNTLRIYTYFPENVYEPIVLGSFVRFGGNDSLIDNASTGGGFCKINNQGFVEDKIFRYKNWSNFSLKEEKDIENLKIPDYKNIIKFVKDLHLKLPYMNLVGWDISVDDKNEPLLIEYNQWPDCEIIQIGQGPMFGTYIEEIMEKISRIKTIYPSVAKQVFPNLPSIHDYNFEIGRRILL